MVKKSFTIVLGLVLAFAMHSQTYTVNQQSQQVNINVPVIEKPVYIERYRTVYVDKPRKARKLEKPVLLLGYLWVYPEDLGEFKQVPVGVINSINAQKPYGRNNWRIPTPDELAVMEANAEKIGLGDDIYLATDHRNGVLRLVAIEGEDLNMANYVKVGKTYWMKTNLGASTPRQSGSVVTYEDAVKYCPAGHRLPTKEEYEELLALGGARFSNILGNNYAELYFPARDVATFYMNETWRESGDYFIQGNSYSLYFGQYRDAGYLTQVKPKIERGGLSKGLVRYVLDK